LVEPINRRGFSGKGAAEDATTEVVGDQNVTSFSVETNQIIKTLRAFTLLDHESEINRESL
jgi:hypothetical protein